MVVSRVELQTRILFFLRVDVTPVWSDGGVQMGHCTNELKIKAREALFSAHPAQTTSSISYQQLLVLYSPQKVLCFINLSRLAFVFVCLFFGTK